MAHEFVYSQPVKIYFGEGKFAKLGEVLEELGVERCVIACGKHFAPTAKEDLWIQRFYLYRVLLSG